MADDINTLANKREIFVREIEKNDGQMLKISQFEVGDVGCVVWDAALVLLKYLETNDFENGNILQGKQVLELGSGTGVVGIQAGSLGADVIVTDLEEFVPLMRLNIENNSGLIKGSVEGRALKWRDDINSLPYNLDYVFCADCIYYQESLEPLVETIEAAANKSTTVLLSFEERTSGNKPELQRKFFELMSDKFEKYEIPLEHQDPLFRSEDIHIIRFNKKR